MAAVTEDVVSNITAFSGDAGSMAATTADAVSSAQALSALKKGLVGLCLSAATMTGAPVEYVRALPVHFEILKQPEFDPPVYVNEADALYTSSTAYYYAPSYKVMPATAYGYRDFTTAAKVYNRVPVTLRDTGAIADSVPASTLRMRTSDSATMSSEVSPNGNIAPWQDALETYKLADTVFTINKEDVQDTLSAQVDMRAPTSDLAASSLIYAEQYFRGGGGSVSDTVFYVDTIQDTSIAVLRSLANAASNVSENVAATLLSGIQVLAQYNLEVINRPIAASAVRADTKLGVAVSVSHTDAQLLAEVLFGGVLTPGDIADAVNSFDVTQTSVLALASASSYVSGASDVSPSGVGAANIHDIASYTDTVGEYALALLQDYVMSATTLNSLQMALAHSPAAIADSTSHVVGVSVYDVVGSYSVCARAAVVDVESSMHGRGRNFFGIAI